MARSTAGRRVEATAKTQKGHDTRGINNTTEGHGTRTVIANSTEMKEEQNLKAELNGAGLATATAMMMMMTKTNPC